MCLISRNEAENVVPCFESWWDDVDEVVLVDSSDPGDQTKMIAEDFARGKGERDKLKVILYTWRDDFAHARKVAEKHATGNWLTWADLDDTVHGMANLRTLAEEAPDELSAIFCLYEYALDEKGRVLCELWRERLVRPGAGEWIDRVHESQLIHHGMIAKADPSLARWTHRKPPFTPTERNLRILTKWLEDEPDNPRVEVNLGRELLGSNRHAEAIPHYEHFLELPGSKEEIRAQARRQLAACYCLEGNFERAKIISLEAVAEHPLWTDSYLTLAEIAATEGKWGECLMHVDQVERLGMPDSVLILNPDDYTLRPKVLRAVAYKNLGRIDEAIELGREVFETHPTFMEIAPQLQSWEVERQLDQSAALWTQAAATLCNYDEPLKAVELLRHVPYYCQDHPTIVAARVGAQEAAEQGYIVDPVEQNSPRANFLLAGLREQLAAYAEDHDWANEPFRILDPSGACRDLLEGNLDTVVERCVIDALPEGHYYDAILLYGDLDNRIDPEVRVESISNEIAVGGRVYVSVREGRAPGGPTPGRKRAWRNVDVAALCRRHGRLEAFGVDEQGYISGCFSPVTRRGEVAILTMQAIGKWHPEDIVTQGLGGSETAAWRLAEHLSDEGYSVTLYGDFEQEGSVKDVILRKWVNFDPTVERRAVIAFRNALVFSKPMNAAKTFLWLEDVAGAEGLTPERMENISFICTVSNWHTENMLEVYPWLDEGRIVTSRNGITLDYFKGDDAVHREPRLLYTSSPDRGLDILLEVWPEIKRRVPEATFVHCYSRWWDQVAEVNSDSARHRDRVVEMSKQDGVTKIPSQGQADLAKLMRSSQVWANPGYWTLGGQKFYETNCISVQEAQAAGCVCVGAAWGALGEMNVTGISIDGHPMEEDFREKLVDAIVMGLTNPEAQAAAALEGPEAMKDRGWEAPTAQLVNLIGG